jgi:hypothetical protein
MGRPGRLTGGAARATPSAERDGPVLRAGGGGLLRTSVGLAPDARFSYN